MGFNKYYVVAIVSLFWVVLPYVFLLMGMPAIDKTSVEVLTNIEEPTVLTYAFVFINWFAFYFKLITLTLPAPGLIKLFLIGLVVLTGLAFISIFRGD